MYTYCKTAVRTHAGTTASFEVGVGLHQGSALTPLQFIIITDAIAENIATTPPRGMLFVDDLVFGQETTEDADKKNGCMEECYGEPGSESESYIYYTYA